MSPTEGCLESAGPGATRLFVPSGAWRIAGGAPVSFESASSPLACCWEKVSMIPCRQAAKRVGRWPWIGPLGSSDGRVAGLSEDVDINEYRAYWRKRRDEDQKVLEERRLRAVAVAAQGAGVLADKYRVRAVYLVGSGAGRGTFHARSDIDIAVEELQACHYFRALCVSPISLRDGGCFHRQHRRLLHSQRDSLKGQEPERGAPKGPPA